MPPGTPGRVRGSVWLSDCLVFLSFKGPTAPGTVFPAQLAHPFLNTFCIIFSDLFFYHNWCQQVPNWEPQKSQKSHKSRQTHHHNASPSEASKKTLSGRGQTSKVDHSYTLSDVFSGAQCCQKGLKMEAKMEPQGTQNHKKSKQASTQKNNKNATLQKVGYWVHFGLQMG